MAKHLFFKLCKGEMQNENITFFLHDYYSILQ
jgi:hypothetical protein